MWVTDLTYVPTRSGMAYVCFIVDAFTRRIVGWRVAANMRTEMVLDALEMARRSRGGRRLVGLVTHSDAGSQFTSVRFTERLDEIGARPSIGTVADCYDNALAETTNGLYKTECVYGPDADGWDDVDELELATLSWVHWFNEHRLHGHCGDVPPAEFEAAFYAAQQADPDRGWNPIARASIRPRATQPWRPTDLAPAGGPGRPRPTRSSRGGHRRQPAQWKGVRALERAAESEGGPWDRSNPPAAGQVVEPERLQRQRNPLARAIARTNRRFR